MERGNLTMVGLNHEVEVLWKYRLMCFACCPEEFGFSTRASASTISMASSDQSEVDPYPSRIKAIPRRQETPLETARPFFSYVRTGEGSSLLTDISVLRTMFPDLDERSLLVCNEGNMEEIEIDFGSMAADVGQEHVHSGRPLERKVNDYYAGPMAQKCVRMDFPEETLTNGLDTLHLDRSGFLLRISHRLRMGQVKML